MPDFTLQPEHLLVVGATGSGKTTLVNTYLLNAPGVACRFIFDDLNRVWPRLRLRACYTAAELEQSIPSRWSAFNSSRAFPGNVKAAFRFWCHWVFHVAHRGPGRKLVCIPELWRFCSDDSIPVELALLSQAGRELGIELVLDTQRPELVNGSVTGATTELICFKLLSHEALQSVKRLGADRERVAALPLGAFVSYNRLSGGTLAGRVF